jgi:hypothetical protein
MLLFAAALLYEDIVRIEEKKSVPRGDALES